MHRSICPKCGHSFEQEESAQDCFEDLEEYEFSWVKMPEGEYLECDGCKKHVSAAFARKKPDLLSERQGLLPFPRYTVFCYDCYKIYRGDRKER